MTTAVPFLDLKAQYLTIKDEIGEALEAVLESTAFVLGPAVDAFEAEFARYAGVEHCVAVNSGTSALQLALLAGGIGRGDEVIIPAMTFIATAAAVEYTGARPVLVDIDPHTYTIDPELVEAAITEHTKAIIAVHLYGNPAEMDPLLEIARRYDLLVIEDAAQAHGAEYNGRRCGSLGDVAAFSFYPGKNLGAYGEGGAVTTNRSDVADRIRMLRDWGQKEKYHHEVIGYNFRMDGFQGAVLGVKMKHIESWTELRRSAASLYDELLGDSAELTIPTQRPNTRHVYHIYPVLVENRDAVKSELQTRGIATGIHYPCAIHLQACFKGMLQNGTDFPVASGLADRELSLPMYPELTASQSEIVCTGLRSVLPACVV